MRLRKNQHGSTATRRIAEPLVIRCSNLVFGGTQRTEMENAQNSDFRRQHSFSGARMIPHGTLFLKSNATCAPRTHTP